MKVNKSWHHLLYADGISFFGTTKCQKIQKKLIKLANIDDKNLHIFWKTWAISIKSSGKMCLMIILKVTKKQCVTPSLENKVLEKPQGKSKIDSLQIFQSYIRDYKNWNHFLIFFFCKCTVEMENKLIQSVILIGHINYAI